MQIGEAFLFGRADWEQVLNTFCFGRPRWYKLVETDTGSCNGNFRGIRPDGRTGTTLQADSAAACASSARFLNADGAYARNPRFD